jgi:uncharacterized pyridoxamine 5'-phosphate oxidase family protein/NAD-dependent dihydropyrimidine dehydrogenase PreA subunit
MNAQDCLNTLRKIRDAAFATVSEDGTPQNRIIDVMIVEDEKLYFCTSRGKEFYRQLTSGGYVAVTGLTGDYKMIRLTGKANKLAEQKKWIDRIFDENPSMNDVYPGEARYILEPFCIDRGELEYFDLNVSPIYRESFTIGGAEITPKGFLITDGCIGCGTCAAACPQQCIDEGSPYAIRQNNCLHCGLCFESCPVEAIERR